MKAEVQREKFLQAVSSAARLTGKNPTLPILSCVLLTTKKDSIEVRATNLEIGVEISVPARVQKEGVVAIPGNILYNTLSLYTDAAVSFEESGGNLILTTPKSTSTIKAKSSEDFPTLPNVSPETSLSLDKAAFMEGLQAVAYSASVSLVKPELSSVYVGERNGALVFVATDSFRLAEKTVAAGKIPEFDPLLIPFRNVPEIIRTLEGVSGEVTLEISETQLSLRAKGLYLTSRLISGAFPDYKQIIPKEFKSEATMLKHDLGVALKKVNVFSDKFNQVNITLTPPKEVVFSARNADVGETTDAIPCSCKGEKLSINFNYRYIAECLQSIPTESVTLHFNGAGKPLLIRGAGDQSFLYLVMPMNK